MTIEIKQQNAKAWFTQLRDAICKEFESIEKEYHQSDANTNFPGIFKQTPWKREGGGGGVISLMKGKVFEKVGVNISTVYGMFSNDFAKDIPGADKNPSFWASGISLVAHMHSPLVPAVHMNTRFIVTQKSWFGGGADLNPMYEDPQDTQIFHEAFKKACDTYSPDYYPKYKAWCDDYFFIKHRNEPRGVGGVFYDYLDSGNWEEDFAFTQDIGNAFLNVYPQLVRRSMYKPWTSEQREHQLVKRGRYAEFNLVYDRGTKFGLMTGGNTEAILMSLPPEAKWL